MKNRALGLRSLCAAVVALSIGGLAHAQDPPPTQPPPAQAPTVQVVEAYALDRDGNKLVGPITLSAVLAVQVSDLPAWIGAQNERCRELRLFFDRQRIVSATPECALEGNLVTFNLGRVNRAEEDAWAYLLATRHAFRTNVDVTLGLGDADTLSSRALGAELVLVNRGWGITALVGLLLVAIGIVYFGRRSNMLRDSGEDPAEGRRPYSLGRVQVAWWFFIVLGSFLLITLLVGATAAIPASVLGLMGISSGTFLAAEIVDANRQAPETPPAPASSKGFLRDVLASRGGVSFHRFQILVWTLVLGIYFAIKVSNSLAMPDFQATLLGLMGISNGTYLGMKIPEKPKAQEG